MKKLKLSLAKTTLKTFHGKGSIDISNICDVKNIIFVTNCPDCCTFGYLDAKSCLVLTVKN